MKTNNDDHQIGDFSLIGDFRLKLQQELVRRCQSNPQYSLRAYARSLRVDHSTLSKIIKGERKLGQRAILGLGSRLGLAPDELMKFVEKGNASAKEISNYEQLKLDTFQVISEWYHFAILELMRIDGFEVTDRSIVRSLGLSLAEAHGALDRLNRVGLIGKEKGIWKDLSKGLTTNIGPAMNSSAHRFLQAQILEKALEAVRTTPLHRRNQTAVTMAVDSRRLEQAYQKITKFRRSLARYLSRAPRKDEVYNLSISLYPLTDLKSKGRGQ